MFPYFSTHLYRIFPFASSCVTMTRWRIRRKVVLLPSGKYHLSRNHSSMSQQDDSAEKERKIKKKTIIDIRSYVKIRFRMLIFKASLSQHKDWYIKRFLSQSRPSLAFYLTWLSKRRVSCAFLSCARNQCSILHKSQDSECWFSKQTSILAVIERLA